MIRDRIKTAIRNSLGWPRDLHPGPAADAAIAEIKRSLFDYIAHGDEEHRAWLKEAIDGFFEGESIMERGQ